jgi:hypothetical protein
LAIGVIEAVKAAIAVLGKNLGKVKVSQAGIENRYFALIFIRNLT